MFDDFLDGLISRLMAGAGLVMASAIAAVAAAMAIFAFLSQWVGGAWAYVIVSAVAAAVVAVWSLAQRGEREKRRKPPIDQRILDVLHAHPTAAFMAGLAAGSLVKGKPAEAAAAWKARKGARRDEAAVERRKR
jgi:O-antigen/teichoic acid export membrane protein